MQPVNERSVNIKSITLCCHDYFQSIDQPSLYQVLIMEVLEIMSLI